MIKGIQWFSVETGETVYTKREAAIKAFINSSNLGPNVHAGQDRGWRLGPEWVKRLEDARKNPDLIEVVTKGTGKISDANLVMELWAREVRAEKNRAIADAEDRPFAQEYQEAISKRGKTPSNGETTSSSSASKPKSKK